MGKSGVEIKIVLNDVGENFHRILNLKFKSDNEIKI